MFEWLRRLPIIELGPAGLRLHDLAVDVLDAELRWRDPLRYRALHDRARGFFLDRLSVADPAEQSAAMMDLIFLHQELRPYLQPGAVAADALRLDTATSVDAPAIVAIIERHEGDESGAIAAAWLAAQPEAWSVVRAADGTVAGLLCALAIEDRAALADVPDPAVDAAYAELARHAPLRAGERCTLIRYWMSTDGYQGVSAAPSLVAVQIGRHYVTTAGLAFSLLSFADPEPWAAATEYSTSTECRERTSWSAAAATPRSATTGGSLPPRTGWPGWPCGRRGPASSRHHRRTPRQCWPARTSPRPFAGPCAG